MPVEVGIGEHQLRRLAAKLKRHRNDVLGGSALDDLADRHRAGEGDVVDARMRGEGGASLIAEARHDVERAVGQAGFLGDLGEGDGGEAGLFGRLQDDGIAHCERAADRAAEHLHGVVPRDDVAGNAMRLAQRVDGVAIEIGDSLAHDFVGGAAVKFHIAGEGESIGARLLQRLADIQCFYAGEIVDALEHEASDTGKDAAAFGGGRLAPRAGEGGLRGGDGGIDVGFCAARDAGEFGAGGWVLDGQIVAAEGGDPTAADEAFGGVEEEVWVGPDIHGVCVRS